MAKLNSNEKQSIKLLLQAYASILEAFPRFVNHYQERLQDQYTLSKKDITVEDNVNFTRDILHDDRIGVVSGEPSILAGFERKLKSHGIQYDKLDRTLLGDDFKAYSNQVLIIRIIDYKAVQELMEEHIREIQNLEEEKSLNEEELEREREQQTKVEEEEESEEESEEEPEEDDEELEDDSDDSFDDDDDDKKKKKKKDKAQNEVQETVEPSYANDEIPESNKGNGYKTPSPETTVPSGRDDIQSYESNGPESPRNEALTLDIYEKKQIINEDTSSHENGQERGFQTGRGLSLSETNDVITDKSERFKRTDDGPSYVDTSGTGTINQTGGQNSESIKERAPRSSYSGDSSGDVTGNTEESNAPSSEGRRYGYTQSSHKDNEHNEPSKGKTGGGNNPYDAHKWTRIEKDGPSDSTFATSKGLSLRDTNDVKENTGYLGSGNTNEQQPEISERKSRRTVSGVTDSHSGRRNIAQVIDFDKLNEFCSAPAGKFKKILGGRRFGDDPATKDEELRKRSNPNITGEPTRSINKKELKGLFNDESLGYREVKDVKNASVNSNTVTDKARVEEIRSNIFNHKVNEHSIDFTKEILQKRFENTIMSLNNMRSVHKVGHIVSRMAMTSMTQNLEGHEIIRDAYHHVAPIAKYTVGRLVADGAAISNANTYVSQNVFSAMFEENCNICGKTDAASMVQRQLLMNKLLHKEMSAINDDDIAKIFDIDPSKMDEFKAMHSKLLAGENISNDDIKKIFKLSEKDAIKWKRFSQGIVNMSDDDIAKLFSIDPSQMGEFKKMHAKLLAGEKITNADIIKRFGLKEEDVLRWRVFTQRQVNFQESDSLMKTLMGVRNGGFASMMNRFKMDNMATVIGQLNTTMEAKKLLLGITQENMRDMAFLNGMLKQLKRMPKTEEAQDLVNVMMAVNLQNTQRMPKFSKLLGSYFALMARKAGEMVRDTDFGHGLNHVTQGARGLSSAYRSLVNLIKASSRMAARLNPRLAVKVSQTALKETGKAVGKTIVEKVGKKFGINFAKAKFGQKASAKMASYLTKMPGSAALKSLVTKITNTATYQAVAAASSSASTAASSAAAVFWEVVAIIVAIVLILSGILMIVDKMNRQKDEESLKTSSSTSTETKNGTLANGILADKDDLLTVIDTELKKKNEEFMVTVNEALNNRGTLSFQVGLNAKENVQHYEAERIVVRDAYGNEIPPNQLDLNNTEAIVAMASRYIPYDFTLSDSASDEKKLENDQMRQYFIDYCDFLWAATHQITIEEYRPGNSSEQVKGIDDAADTSGMTTDANTGACPKDGTVMWLQESFIPNTVIEKDDDGKEVSQQCSTCDEPITDGTGFNGAGLCSHPKDDDLDEVVRIDGWRRTEEWRWAVNCLNGYSDAGHGDHTHAVFAGRDDDGDPEYVYEFEACKLSPSEYGHDKTYAYDKNGIGGSLHIHEEEHLHKEYKWVYECGGHMGVVVYITVGDMSRMPSMKAAKDIEYDLIGKYVKYDPESLKRHSSIGGVYRFTGINRGKNWGLTKPYKGTSWPLLSDQEIRKITAACYNEQGSLEGVMYEASLLAKTCDKGTYGHDPSTVIQSGWFHWTTHESYKNCKPHYGGTVTEEMVDAVKKILREGERILDCDEHDNFGMIAKIVTNGVVYTSQADIRNRDNYIPGETIIYNTKNSTYKFLTFAVEPGKEGDPFGTTDLNAKVVFDDDTDSGKVSLDGYNLEGDATAIEAAISFGMSKKGIVKYSRNYRTTGNYYDCSSFVYYCYEAAGINLGGTHSNPPNTDIECKTLEQKGRMVCETYDESLMQPGDLIFWSLENTGHYKQVSHVGMYIGDGKILHCSNGVHGVGISTPSDFGEDMKKVVSVCRPT